MSHCETQKSADHVTSVVVDHHDHHLNSSCPQEANIEPHELMTKWRKAMKRANRAQNLLQEVMYLLDHEMCRYQGNGGNHKMHKSCSDNRKNHRHGQHCHPSQKQCDSNEDHSASNISSSSSSNSSTTSSPNSSDTEADSRHRHVRSTNKHHGGSHHHHHHHHHHGHRHRSHSHDCHRRRSHSRGHSTSHSRRRSGNRHGGDHHHHHSHHHHNGRLDNRPNCDCLQNHIESGSSTCPMNDAQAL